MDVTAVRLFVMAVAGWWADERQASVAYLIEENRILRARLRGRKSPKGALIQVSCPARLGTTSKACVRTDA